MELKNIIMQDKTPRNKYGQKHGQWIVYYSEAHNKKPNELFYIEYYINDKQVGYSYTNWSYGNEEIKYHAK